MSGRAVVSCYRCLGVTSFVLQVRSWSGNTVPIYECYFLSFLPCQKRAKSQGTTFTLKCPILDKQKQISFGSSLRDRFPHSSQLSFLMEPGTQYKTSCLLRLSK